MYVPASAPKPDTTLSAPWGRPAAIQSSPKSRQDSGASSEGFKTMQQPAAIAGMTCDWGGETVASIAIMIQRPPLSYTLLRLL